MTADKRRKKGIIRERAKRSTLYGVIFFFIAILQCSFFSGLDFLPAVPCLTIGAVAVIALQDDIEAALIAGIIGGVITDALGGTGIYLSPVLYLAAALAVGLLAKKMMVSFLSYIALLPIACVLRGMFTLLEIYIYRGDIAWKATLLGTVLPELLLTFVLALPLYPIIRICTKPLLRRSDAMKGNI